MSNECTSVECAIERKWGHKSSCAAHRRSIVGILAAAANLDPLKIEAAGQSESIVDSNFAFISFLEQLLVHKAQKLRNCSLLLFFMYDYFLDHV